MPARQERNGLETSLSSLERTKHLLFLAGNIGREPSETIKRRAITIVSPISMAKNRGFAVKNRGFFDFRAHDLYHDSSRI